MQIVTSKHLDARTQALNELTGSPTEYWANAKQHIAAVGHFYVDYSNSRYSLQRTTTISGDSKHICNLSGNKRDIAALIDAFILGWCDARRSVAVKTASIENEISSDFLAKPKYVPF